MPTNQTLAPDYSRHSLTRILIFCLILCATTLALFAFSSDIPIVSAAPNAFPSSISFAQIATGLSQPVHVTNANDGTGRIFVVERSGRIRIYNGSLFATPFLDITARVQSGGGEQGLLSVAFPPNYANKGWFYIYYVDLSGDIQISRFRITGNPDIADPSSEQMILKVPHPGQSNHNGGQLQFGRDGFLYIGTGDGGSGGDPPNNAQTPTVLLGKMLRLNVEPGYHPNLPPVISFTPAYTSFFPILVSGPITPPLTYTIPISNPFTATVPYRAEIWALGLRNPWRFSFDRANGDLYIGDVGQNCWEEINYTPATSNGMNFGWRLEEGFRLFDPNNQFNCGQPFSTLLTTTKPITAYDHLQGTAVIGGYVYRGASYAQTNLYGTYIFSDEGTGRFWAAQQSGGVWATKFLTPTAFRPSSFGEDQNGELYFVDYPGGGLYQVKTP